MNLNSSGRRLAVQAAEVITGVARSISGQRGEGASDLLSRGEVAMIIDMANPARYRLRLNLDPNCSAGSPTPPPGPAGSAISRPRITMQSCTPSRKRPKHERDAIWTTALPSRQNIVNSDFESMVLKGWGDSYPQNLQRLGYDEYIRDIPMALQKTPGYRLGLIKAILSLGPHWF